MIAVFHALLPVNRNDARLILSTCNDACSLGLPSSRSECVALTGTGGKYIVPCLWIVEAENWRFGVGTVDAVGGSTYASF
jgi:hypothetical protein